MPLYLFRLWQPTRMRRLIKIHIKHIYNTVYRYFFGYYILSIADDKGVCVEILGNSPIQPIAEYRRYWGNLHIESIDFYNGILR